MNSSGNLMCPKSLNSWLRAVNYTTAKVEGNHAGRGRIRCAIASHQR